MRFGIVSGKFGFYSANKQFRINKQNENGEIIYLFQENPCATSFFDFKVDLRLDYFKTKKKLEILAQNFQIDVSHSIRRVRSSEKNMMEPMNHTLSVMKHYYW